MEWGGEVGGVGGGVGLDWGKGGGEVLRRNIFEEHNYKI